MGDLDTKRTESNDSDIEFWNELDKVFTKQKPILPDNNLVNFAQKLFSHISPPKIPEIIQKPSEPKLEADKNTIHHTDKVNWSAHHFNEKITRIRQAKDEELTAHSIMIRNKTKKEYKNMFKELEIKYNQDIGALLQEHEELKMVIFSKEKTIGQLSSMLIDFQVFFSEQRYESAYNGNESPRSPKGKAQMQLLEDVKNLNNQVGHLKEICYLYKEDTTKAMERAKKAEEEREKSKVLYEKEIANLKNMMEMKEKEWKDCKTALENEFQKYKTNIQKELELRELIDERAKEHIQSLKDELKNAKIVMQNPRLRSRIRDRLSDYMTDHEKSLNEVSRPPSIPPPSHPQSQSYRTRKIHSSYKSSTPSNQMASFDLSTSFEDETLSTKGIFARKVEFPLHAPLFRRKIVSSGCNKSPIPSLL